MGVVYAALDIDLARKVAIKILLPKVAQSAQAVTRFINEGRAAASIEGEHVARIFAAGRTSDGLAYIVMELLEGEDFAHLLQRRPRMAVAEAVDFVLEALEAVAEAHRNGIVHRDLKPGNLFLAKRRDHTELVKVLDFGISKTANPLADADEQAMTSTRATLGSPLYMSPEQLRSAKNVDRRADIWSVGVILYQMLTGALPFAGETLGELFAAILEQTPTPIERYRTDIPGSLKAAIYRCLERDPSRRFRDVYELAHALVPHAERSERSLDKIQSFSDKVLSATPVVVAQSESPASQSAPGGSTTGATSTGGTPVKRAHLSILLAIPVAFVVAGSIVTIFLFARPHDAPRAASPAVEASLPGALPSVMPAAVTEPPRPTLPEAPLEALPSPPPAQSSPDAGAKPPHSTHSRVRPEASSNPKPAASQDEPAFDPMNATRK